MFTGMPLKVIKGFSRKVFVLPFAIEYIYGQLYFNAMSNLNKYYCKVNQLNIWYLFAFLNIFSRFLLQLRSSFLHYQLTMSLTATYIFQIKDDLYIYNSALQANLFYSNLINFKVQLPMFIHSFLANFFIFFICLLMRFL